MLYECTRIILIWKELGQIFGSTITWKRLVFGYSGNSFISPTLTLIKTLVSHCIFKEWVKCKQHATNNYARINLKLSCFNALLHYESIVEEVEFVYLQLLYFKICS